MVRKFTLDLLLGSMMESKKPATNTCHKDVNYKYKIQNTLHHEQQLHKKIDFEGRAARIAPKIQGKNKKVDK